MQTSINTLAEELSRIANALESIDNTLNGIDHSLEQVSDLFGDCRVEYPRSSAIAITGIIDHA